MSVSAIEAGKAFVKFFIDDDDVDPGLARIGAKFTKFGAIGAAISAPIVAGFAAAVVTAVTLGSELQDLHQRTGLAVETLSFLGFAAKQTGTDLGVIEKAIKELQKDGIDTLQFEKMLAELAKIPDHAARAKRALDLFGARNGTQLLPMIEDLPKLRKEFERLNLVVSGEAAAALDDLGDAFDASKSQLQALAIQIGVALAPALKAILETIQPIVASIIRWVHENPRLTATIAAVAAGVLAVSTAAIAVGGAFAAITAAGGLAAIAALAAPLLPVVAVLAGIAGVALAVAAAFDAMSKSTWTWADALENVLAVVSPLFPLLGAIQALVPGGVANPGGELAIGGAFNSAVGGAFGASAFGSPAAQLAGVNVGGSDPGVDWLRQIAASNDALLNYFTSGRGAFRAGAK